jgi:TatD DNase family protein
VELIDSHSHLYLDHFKDDQQEVIARCKEAGVNRILLPNIDLESVDQIHGLCELDSEMFIPMMGLHPCSVKEDYEAVLAKIKENFASRKYCAVGEIGIDLYWDKSTLEIQKAAFIEQIAWAKEFRLPIVIHARDSYDEIFEVIDELNDATLTGVFHCFTGTVEQARHIIEYGGFMLGIGGVATFKNGGLDKVLPELGLEHLILETDAPYLAPVPYRGKRNESSYVRLVADRVAEICEKSTSEVAEETTANAEHLFHL